MGQIVDDAARAARLVAAASADDAEGVGAVMLEARTADRIEELLLAVAAHFVDVARQFYDTDCQGILDRFALEAMNFDTDTNGL